jgi:hypothetical protein
MRSFTYCMSASAFGFNGESGRTVSLDLIYTCLGAWEPAEMLLAEALLGRGRRLWIRPEGPGELGGRVLGLSRTPRQTVNRCHTGPLVCGGCCCEMELILRD